jgi:hypothetical protein
MQPASRTPSRAGPSLVGSHVRISRGLACIGALAACMSRSEKKSNVNVHSLSCRKVDAPEEQDALGFVASFVGADPSRSCDGCKREQCHADAGEDVE